MTNSKTERIEKINGYSFKQKLMSYTKHPGSFILYLLTLAAILVTIFITVSLIGYILVKGLPNLRLDMFEWEYNSNNSSFMYAIINTITMTLLSLLFAAPIGIFSAIYLVEYANKKSKIVNLIRLTNETLSGIPSIVYGLFGMLFFVIKLNWGFSMLAGAATLAIMILPLIMRTTEEALLSVPATYREASFGLGAGKLRTVFKIVLPSAMPGILAGIILAIGRIVGETAALIYTAGTVTKVPESVMNSGGTLAIHMYSMYREGLRVNEASATAVILLVTVILINWMSSFLAKKLTKGK